MGKRFATTEELPLSDQIKGAFSNPKPDRGATEADTLYGKNFEMMAGETTVMMMAAEEEEEEETDMTTTVVE